MAENLGSEERIVQSCKNRLAEVPPAPNPAILVTGVALGMYEFMDNGVAGTPKSGNIFLANRAERITLVKGQGPGDRGSIEFPKARGVNFWICEAENKAAYVDMMRLIMGLKHNGLLKTYFTVYSDQLSNMVSACGATSKTLQTWLADIPIKTSLYFSHKEKELLLTLYNCVEYIWEQGFTSDALSDINSYRMLDHRIKLSTLVLRRRTAEDNNFLPLKNDLANLLEANFLPKWPDVEFHDFINFLREPYSSTSSILGYPIFLPPPIRQIMYRSLSVKHMSPGQVQELQARVPPPLNWRNTITEQQYFVLHAIFTTHCNNSTAVEVALLLAHYVSAHYIQRLKLLRKNDWQKFMKRDIVDRYLKECLPGLLTKRYALDQDPTFRFA